MINYKWRYCIIEIKKKKIFWKCSWLYAQSSITGVVLPVSNTCHFIPVQVQSLESQVRGLQDDLFAAQEELQVTMEKHEQVRNLIVTQGLQSLL